MEVMDINLNEIKINDQEKISTSLKRGQVVVLATDTIYGFTCLADNQEAIKKIRKIKKRKKDKNFIVLVSSLKMAETYCYFSEKQKQRLSYLWRQSPPSSIILNSRGQLAPSLEQSGSLALRLPKSDFLITIIRRLGKPLVSTSFNFSGQALIDINKAELVFNKKNMAPDLIVRAGQNQSSRPSRLIDGRWAQEIILRN